MADTPDPSTLLEPLSPQNPPSRDSSDIATRVREWYVEATGSTLWTRYLQEADEDEGYYTGVTPEGQPFGAWSKDQSTQDARDLAAEGRPVIQIRHIKPQIDILVGTERQSRMDPRALPQGDEDEDDARLLTQTMKWASDQAELNETVSEMYKDGLIRGMSVTHLGIDWSSNALKGELIPEKLTVGREVIIDPKWKRYDLQDARFILRPRWAWIEDLIAQYAETAEQEAKLREGFDQIAPLAVSGVVTTSLPGDNYGSVTNHPLESAGGYEQFYDPALRQTLVIEAWYREWRTRWMVYDKITTQTAEAGSAAEARKWAATDPDHLTAIRRRERRVRVATILPATLAVLEDEDSPYENDAEAFPFVAYIADRTGDVIEGLVRGLKDPSRIENKRISQAIELAQKFASMRPMAEEGALVNPEALLTPGDQSVLWLRPGRMASLGWFRPEGLSESVQILEALAQNMKTSMREVGPTGEHLGQPRSAGLSGIALARLQIQSQTTMLPYFDNLRRTRKLLYERLARRVQQMFSLEETIRLTDEVHGTVQVRLNPGEFRRKGFDAERLKALRDEARADPSKPQILRDIEAIKYDITLSEAPSTPTARVAVIEQLIQVVDKYPSIFPVIADKLFLLIPDLPDRPELVRRIRRWQALQGLGDQPASPPAPGAPGSRPGPGAIQPGAVPGEAGVTVAPAPPAAMVPAPMQPGALPTAA